MVLPIGMRVQLSSGVSGHVEGLPFGDPGRRRQRIACDDGVTRAVSIERATPRAAFVDTVVRLKPRLRLVGQS